ncbi:MAG: hypothetical protein ACTS4V_00635 [Candidatus Hodgkinia cicadicola]
MANIFRCKGLNRLRSRTSKRNSGLHTKRPKQPFERLTAEGYVKPRRRQPMET